MESMTSRFSVGVCIHTQALSCICSNTILLIRKRKTFCFGSGWQTPLYKDFSTRQSFHYTLANEKCVHFVHGVCVRVSQTFRFKISSVVSLKRIHEMSFFVKEGSAWNTQQQQQPIQQIDTGVCFFSEDSAIFETFDNACQLASASTLLAASVVEVIWETHTLTHRYIDIDIDTHTHTRTNLLLKLTSFIMVS